MAGYDLYFSVNKKHYDDVRGLLRAFQSMGDEILIDVHYRTKKTKEIIECKVEVDGHLSGMQVLENQFIDLVEGAYQFKSYIGKRKEIEEYWDHVVLPMIRANKRSLEEVTKGIEAIAEQTGGIVTPGSTASSLKMMKLYDEDGDSNISRLVKVWQKTRSEFYRYYDDEGHIQRSILIDRAIEVYLKSSLGIAGRVDFPTVTKSAVEKKIINGSEKIELDKFHTKRNKAQHHNKTVADDELYEYLIFLAKLINKFCVGESIET